MCQSVTIPHLDFYTGNVQQLADRLGVLPIDLVWCDGGPAMIDGGFNFCLCPINLEATAKKFGYKFDRDDWGDGVFLQSDGQ